MTATKILKCLHCGKPVPEPDINPYRPFCCARCKQIDLGRWLKGDYKIPTDEGPEPGLPHEKLEVF